MGTHGSVMVIEDDEDVRDAITGSLVHAGYGVSVASHGAAALETLQTADVLPDVIFLDLMMPIMDGERFLRALREDPRLAALPVVLLTGDGGADEKTTALHANARLEKPVQLSDLLSTAAQYCHAH
jgi:CheY-like chemotaxis protein